LIFVGSESPQIVCSLLFKKDVIILSVFAGSKNPGIIGILLVKRN
jgi:hypothetical protein